MGVLLGCTKEHSPPSAVVGIDGCTVGMYQRALSTVSPGYSDNGYDYESNVLKKNGHGGNKLIYKLLIPTQKKNINYIYNQ